MRYQIDGTPVEERVEITTGSSESNGTPTAPCVCGPKRKTQQRLVGLMSVCSCAHCNRIIGSARISEGSSVYANLKRRNQVAD